MAQNLVEKIAEAHAVELPREHEVHSGDFLAVRPAHVMTHDNTAPVMSKFRTLGATRVADPRQPVFAMDHDVQNRSDANLTKYRSIEAFAREHGIAFYPPGRGIAHQVLCEEGFVLPGSLVVASDSHANLYGGLAALGTPVVRTDAAALWATGRTWYQVPPVTRCAFVGELRPGVAAKDVIITLCGRFSNDEVLNHAVEFTGPGVRSLSIAERLTIANMTTEWGALAGVFPCDERTLEWLDGRLERLGEPNRGDLSRARLDALRVAPPSADAGARYAQSIVLDLARVEPSISGPNEVKVMTSLAEMRERRQTIHKAYLLSCVNGRADDFTDAAEALAGKPVADGVQLYIAAASSEVEAESRRRGDWQRLIDAGARPLPPGCGPCIGLGEGLLEDGEVGISATNRNFRGRMGSRDAEAYLASPAVVAASAAAGYITSPWDGAGGLDVATIERADPAPAPAAVAIRAGFPRALEGDVLFLDADNLDTDGIYSKDWTYRDDVTPRAMAEVAMANYDPQFRSKARAGDILVGGFNFGTGSSREQAATCLKFLGIRLLVAGSFSETYKRNAFNNGYLCLECPALVLDLRERFATATAEATRRTELALSIDFETSTARLAGTAYPIRPLGLAAQDLVLAGGLEAQVRATLSR
jgi:homoaconitate hydratase